MDFDYIVADPTGNITVLVTSPYTEENRNQIIREAFEKEPSCEQVGFIMPADKSDEYADSGRASSETSPDACKTHSDAPLDPRKTIYDTSPNACKTIRLEMMGYEFCGHATLSAAAYLAQQNGLAAGEEDVFTIDSSGVDGLLDVRLRKLDTMDSAAYTDPNASCNKDSDSHSDVLPVYQGTVSMPRPEVDSYQGYPLIRFGGISHLIVPSDAFTEEQAESSIREFSAELGVPALGMMICEEYDRLIAGCVDSGELNMNCDDQCRHGANSDGASADEFTIRPLVYVPGSATLFWEHGCATGSTALGWYRYHLNHRNSATEIRQPGGIIRVDIVDGQPQLTGRVVLR